MSLVGLLWIKFLDSRKPKNAFRTDKFLDMVLADKPFESLKDKNSMISALVTSVNTIFDVSKYLKKRLRSLEYDSSEFLDNPFSIHKESIKFST